MQITIRGCLTRKFEKKKIDEKKIDRKLKIYLILQPYFVYYGRLDIYQFLLILIDFLLT